jgi:chemotaxis response regulator CheB
MKIKVLVADDNEAVLTTMCRILKDDPRIELVGGVKTFPETLDMIRDTRPDVLVLDLHLPVRGGFDSHVVKTALTPVCTIAVSLSNDEEAEFLSKSYGAIRLLDKVNLFRELFPAVLECGPKAPPGRRMPQPPNIEQESA